MSYLLLNSSSLRRTATIVWQWRNINNLRYLNACAMYGTDCGLTSVTRPLYISLYLSQAKIECDFRTILGSHLSCIGSVLLRPAESHLTRRRP